MLDSMLREGNLKIGRFTGPHLLQFNERFHINGQAVSDSEFTKRVLTLKTQSDLFAERFPDLGGLSWFELLTAFAFSYFADQGVDLAVIEVGLGGRFDATNVLQKLYATGITNIALEHEHILGSSLEKIAMEKAGIIKAGVPVVTGAVQPALGILTRRAADLQSKLIVCSQFDQVGSRSNFDQDTSFPQLNAVVLPGLEKIKEDICRHGIYQYENAVMAVSMLAASDLLDCSTADGASCAKLVETGRDGRNLNELMTRKISIKKAWQGLKNFYWPGRFQIIESENIILDGAHNPAGIKALRQSLDYLLPSQRFHFIFTCYADKDGLAMVKNLVQPQDILYLGMLSGNRSFFDNSNLASCAEELSVARSIHSTIGEAFEEAKRRRCSGEFIVVTGSFSLIKTIMQTLGWTTVADGGPTKLHNAEVVRS